MAVLALIPTPFRFSGHILGEECFLPCCAAVLVFLKKAQEAHHAQIKIILSCPSWNVAHQTGLCWVVRAPGSFRCSFDRTHCFQRPWEWCSQNAFSGYSYEAQISTGEGGVWGPLKARHEAVP